MLIFFQQIGAQFFGQLFCLLVAPSVDVFVVSRNEHVGHLYTVELIRACVLGIFQKPRGNALFLIALGIGEHTIAKASNAVGENACGDLTTREHKIADGNFLIHDFVNDAAVNALVVTAKENEVVIVACKLGGARTYE